MLSIQKKEVECTLNVDDRTVAIISDDPSGWQSRLSFALNLTDYHHLQIALYALMYNLREIWRILHDGQADRGEILNGHVNHSSGKINSAVASYTRSLTVLLGYQFNETTWRSTPPAVTTLILHSSTTTTLKRHDVLLHTEPCLPRLMQNARCNSFIIARLACQRDLPTFRCL